MVGTSMFLLLLITAKDLNEVKEDLIKNEVEEENQGSMPYKETCSLCKGNGYIKVVIDMGKEEIKQCWLCESNGEKEYSQAEVDDLIYKMYYKKGGTNAV